MDVISVPAVGHYNHPEELCIQFFKESRLKKKKKIDAIDEFVEMGFSSLTSVSYRDTASVIVRFPVRTGSQELKTKLVTYQ